MSDFPRWGTPTSTSTVSDFPSWGSPTPAAPPVPAPAPQPLPEMQQAVDALPPNETEPIQYGLRDLIARMPEPDNARDLVQTAIALHQMMGIPFAPALNHAQALQRGDTASQHQALTIGRAWNAMKIDTRISALWDVARKSSPEDEAAIVARIHELEQQRPNVDLNDGNVIQRAFFGLVGVISQMKETALGVVPQEMARDALFADGTPLGQRLGKLFGAGGSFLWGIGRIEGGSTYGYLRGLGIDREIANRAAEFVGSINTGIEIVGDVAFAGLLGVFGKAGQAVLPSVFKKFSAEAIKSTVARVALSATAKLASGTAENAAEEFAQGMVTAVAQKLAVDAENEFRAVGEKIPRERIQAAIEDWAKGLPTYAAMGALPAVTEMARSGTQRVVSSVVSALDRETVTKQPSSAPIRAKIDQTLADLQTARQAQREAEATAIETGVTPPAATDVAPFAARLQEHATELETAINTRVAEVAASPEITDADVADLMDLAATQDMVQGEIGKLQPKEAPAVSRAPDPFTTDIREAIRTNLPQFSEREVTAAGLVMDFRARREGVATQEYVARTFAPGVFSAPEVAAQTIAQGRNANAAVSFLDDGKALIHAAEQTDFKALVHEFAHVFRRQLSEEEQTTIAASFGEGVAAEEAFAEGFVRFLQTGETENTELRPLYAELSDLLSGFRVQFDDVIPPETKTVFDGILGGPQTQAATATGPRTLFNPMATKPMEGQRTEGRRTSVTIGDVTLTRDQLSKIDERLPDVMESNIRGNNKEGLLAALRDMDLDLLAANEPGKQAALQAITKNVEATDIEEMSARARGPGNRPDLLFNTREEQEAEYDEARRYDSPEEYAAMAQTMDLDPKSEDEYRKVWEAAQTTPPSRERENARFIQSVENKEAFQTLLLEMWRAENERPQLPNMDVHQLLKNAVAKAPDGISDAAYKKLMDQIRNDPTRYRSVVARVLGNEAMQDQIARERFTDPDADALEKEKETNRELRRQNAKLQGKIGDLEKSIAGWELATTREGMRADFAAGRAAEIAKRAGGERVVAQQTIRDLLDQIKEEQRAQQVVIRQAETAYREAVREGKAAVVEARREERDRASAKAAEIRNRLTAALDQQRQKLKDYREAVRTKALAGKLVRSIMREAGPGLPIATQDQIIAIQDSIVTAFIPAWQRTREAIQQWQAKNPGKPLSPYAQKVMSQLSAKDLTVAELEAMERQVSDLRAAGYAEMARRKFLQWQEDIKDWNDAMIAVGNVDAKKKLPAMVGGETFRNAERSTPKEWVDWIMARPNRWAMWLDGGKQGANYRLVVEMTRAAEDAKVVNLSRRQEAIVAKMKELGVKTSDLRKVFELNGQRFNHNEALAVYLTMQNPDGARHVTDLRGNNIAEETAKKMIAQLSPKEKAFGEAIMEVFQGQDKERLRKFSEEELNIRFAEVERYFPLYVTSEGNTTLRHEDQLAADLVARSGVRRGSVKAGMLKQRTGSTRPIQLNAMAVALDAIQKHEHLIAYKKAVQKLNFVYFNPAMVKEIKRIGGTEALSVVQKWVNDVANPAEDMQYDPIAKMSGKMRANVTVSGIAGNVLTMAKNLPMVGAWVSLPYSSVPHMLGAIAQWIGRGGGDNALYHFVTERDPQIKDRVIDPDVTALHRTEWSKARNALDRINRLLLIPLEQFDMGTVLIAWKAAYDKKYAETGDEQAAITHAREAIERTQPQGKWKDLPMFLKSPQGRWLALFGNQLNQMYNMELMDLPMEMKNREKTAAQKVAYAVRLATGFAITGILMGMVDRKRLPEPEEIVEDVASQFLAPVPVLGPATVNWLMGKQTFGGTTPATPIVETAQAAKGIVKAVGEGDTAEIGKAVLDAAPDAIRLIGGPAVPVQRAIRAIREQDPWWLVGGPPEEK